MLYSDLSDCIIMTKHEWEEWKEKYHSLGLGYSDGNNELQKMSKTLREREELIGEIERDAELYIQEVEDATKKLIRGQALPEALFSRCRKADCYRSILDKIKERKALFNENHQ